MDTIFGRPGIGRVTQIGVLALDQVVRSSLRLGITLSVARFCSREDFSFYTTLQPVYLYMLLFCTSFILGPYNVLVHDKPRGGTGGYTAALSVLFFGAVVLLAAVYMVLYRQIYTPGYYAGHFLAGSLWFIVGDLFNVFSRNLCLSRLSYARPLLSGICSALLFGAGFLAMRDSITLSGILLLAGSGYIIPSFVIWLLSEKKLSRFSLKHEIREVVFNHYNFGKWVFLNNVLNTMVFASFPFFLRMLGKSDQIGAYGTYYNFFAVFNPGILVLTLFLAPRLAKSYKEGPAIFSGRIRKVLKYTAVFSGVLLCLLLLGGRSVFSLFYGGEYSVLGGLMLIWGIAKTIEINSCVLNAAMKATRQTFRIFVSSVIGAGVFVAAGLPLVKFTGLWGIGMCLVVTQVAWSASLWYFLSAAQGFRVSAAPEGGLITDA